MKKVISAGIVVCMVCVTLGVPGVRAQERDPFASILISQPKDADFNNIVLKGTLWNKGRAVAIINDELYMVGDSFLGFTISSIDKSSVVLMFGDKRHTLFMPQDQNTAPKKTVSSKLPDAQENVPASEPEPAPASPDYSLEESPSSPMQDTPELGNSMPEWPQAGNHKENP